MTESANLYRFRSGEAIVARDAESREISGRIDAIAPDLNVLWIREERTGERRLLVASAFRIARGKYR